jgi:hypothetical protein
MSIRELLTNFHVGTASGWDLFVILIFLVAVLVYGFFLGRNRMIILLLGSYFSLIISQVIPWSRISALGWLGIGQEPSASLKILVFVGLILLFYFFIPRSVLSSALRIKKRGEAVWWQIFVLSIVQLGLLAAIIFSFLPGQTIADFTPLVKKIFIGPEAQFIWLTLPILFIVLMRRKKKIED